MKSKFKITENEVDNNNSDCNNSSPRNQPLCSGVGRFRVKTMHVPGTTKDFDPGPTGANCVVPYLCCEIAQWMVHSLLTGIHLNHEESSELAQP